MNLNEETWKSVIRSVGLVVGGGLAYAGLVNQTTASDIVQRMVDAAPIVVQAIGVIMPIALAIWGAFTHTDKSVVHAASQVQGVAEPIKIAPDAPADLQELAHDPQVPSVEAAAPFPGMQRSGRRL